jgi:predicted nucleic-acid-binding protein
MIGLDTNVLVRYLVQDVPTQTRQGANDPTLRALRMPIN